MSQAPEYRGHLSVMRAVLVYLTLAGAGHLLWEAAQLPLYTIWWTGTRRETLFAVIHCTGGDLLITASSLVPAALVARITRWPLFGGRTALTAIPLGLGYSVFSEWLNIHIRQSWSYTEAMPVLPPLGTGLTPFLQWLIVPGIALGYVGRKVKPSDSFLNTAAGSLIPLRDQPPG
jgi:hypothetical protein